ncbi:hypothetical protein KCU65_g5168, partial [Aureobasidium melanogenum]
MAASSSNDELEPSPDSASSNEERIIDDDDDNDTEESPVDDVLSAHIAAEIDLVTSSNVDKRRGMPTPTLDESIGKAFFSDGVKRDFHNFASRMRQGNRPSSSKKMPPGSIHDEFTRNFWNVAAARLLPKAINGNFTDADLISWSHSMKARLALFLHYPPKKGTPDYGTTFNPLNVCVKALMRKFGSLEDCFMMDLVPIKCQRRTDLPPQDQRFGQPYMSQFGSQMEAKVVICFGKCVTDLIKWLHPSAKRLTFGDQLIFQSMHHVLAVCSDAGAIERIFIVCYHPEALLYPQDPARLTMLDQLVNMGCVLAGLVGFNPTSFVDSGRIAKRTYVKALASTPEHWEQRVLVHGRLVALLQMRREEIRSNMKIETKAIPAALLLELYTPNPPNFHKYTWQPGDIQAESVVHEIVIKVVFRLPPSHQGGPLIDGDAQMTYSQHLGLIKLAGTPLLNCRQVIVLIQAALSTKVQVKEAEKWVAAISAAKPNSESLEKLALQHQATEYWRRSQPLDKALREESDRLGVAVKELPAATRAKIRLNHGFAPSGKLEQRSSLIVTYDLPMLLSGHDMVIEYNKRLYKAKRRNWQVESTLLDMQAAQSNSPDALLDRLLSQEQLGPSWDVESYTQASGAAGDTDDEEEEEEEEEEEDAEDED